MKKNIEKLHVKLTRYCLKTNKLKLLDLVDLIISPIYGRGAMNMEVRHFIHTYIKTSGKL